MALTKVGKEGVTGISNSSNATAITIDSSEKVGIGTTSPSSYNGGADDLVIATTGATGITIASGTTSNGSLFFADGTSGADQYRGYVQYEQNNNAMAFGTNGAERMRIDSSGNVGINTSVNSLFNAVGGVAKLAVTGESSSTNILGNTDASIAIINTDQTANNTAGLHFARADTDNTPNYAGASIVAQFPDAQATGQYPKGELAFLTSTTANAAPSEKMRVDSAGNLHVGKTATGIANAGLSLRGDADVAQFTRSGDAMLELNRLANDGALVIFYQAGTQEGNISVSGTTVSYNGGHLARWSQATDGNRINGLVKGTVMTNLDQMAVWHHEAQAASYYEEGDELPEGVSVGDEKTPAVDAYDEDNEQLNCMAVSSVEGDANIAGVFVNYDDDDTDYTADMNIAMTGDMVIRIASGTTVARGDLLMSAGDGTAKPQGDDIVRSKTIAKVTSITVSHTYDDGSYLVPCVLMAC